MSMISILIDRVSVSETLIVDAIKDLVDRGTGQGEWYLRYMQVIEGIRTRITGVERCLRARTALIKRINRAYFGKYEFRVDDNEVRLYLVLKDRHYLMPENDTLVHRLHAYDKDADNFNSIDDANFPFCFIRRVTVTAANPCNIICYDLSLKRGN